MLRRFDKFYSEVVEKFESIGFSVKEDSDYMVTFSNASGILFIFECDRVTDGYTLYIESHGLAMAVWVIMRMYNVVEPPSLMRQMEFIKDELLRDLPPDFPDKYNDYIK